MHTILSKPSAHRLLVPFSVLEEWSGIWGCNDNRKRKIAARIIKPCVADARDSNEPADQVHGSDLSKAADFNNKKKTPLVGQTGGSYWSSLWLVRQIWTGEAC